MNAKKMLSASEALELAYPFIAQRSPIAGWSIVFPDLPGCTSWALTWETIGTQAREASQIWIESLAADGLLAPAPTSGPEVEPVDLALLEEPASQLMTSSQVAEYLGISVRRVNALSKARNIGRRLGNFAVFTANDVERLRPGNPGRPRTQHRDDAAA